jgi:N-acetyl-anhydromuramyl-L-alanine amidase AmpD
MIDFKKPKRDVDTVFLHCSASDNYDHDDISVIRDWHLKRGFDDVGYHFFIKKNGTVQLGRSLEETPAAQQGYNLGSIAICLHGLKKENFTKEQYNSLVELCNQIDRAYGKILFRGHKEVSNKECPVFDYKAVLNLDDKGYIKSSIKKLTIKGRLAKLVCQNDTIEVEYYE